MVMHIIAALSTVPWSLELLVYNLKILNSELLIAILSQLAKNSTASYIQSYMQVWYIFLNKVLAIHTLCMHTYIQLLSCLATPYTLVTSRWL